MNTDNPIKGTNAHDILKRVNAYRLRFPIIFNIVAIGITTIIVIWIILFFLDAWTLHGKEQIVPDVKGQNMTVALQTLRNEGLEPSVSDSIYDTSAMPGTVVEQNPHPNSRVKPGRSVYLTIVAYNPKMVTFPDVVNTSLRQGQSMLQGIGFKTIIISRVPSEYQDLVLGAKCNGKDIRPGQRLPVNSIITLEVGEEYSEDENADEDGQYIDMDE